jgi:hypothetical protein
MWVFLRFKRFLNTPNTKSKTILRRVTRMQMIQEQYHVFEASKIIKVKLFGKNEAMQLSFVKWGPKEDRPQGSFLFAYQPDGVVRVINDLFIESVNGKPFKALPQ